MEPDRKTLEEILVVGLKAAANGKTASHIPALAEADPAAAGIAVTLLDGAIISAGDAHISFSIQSISKILTLAYVIRELGENAVFSRSARNLRAIPSIRSSGSRRAPSESPSIPSSMQGP